MQLLSVRAVGLVFVLLELGGERAGGLGACAVISYRCVCAARTFSFPDINKSISVSTGGTK